MRRVINDAYKSLNLENPQLQSIPKKAKYINNHTVSLVILGTGAVLAATATVVSLVFAAHLAAIVCAAVFVILTISFVVVNQFHISAALKELIKKMAEKLKSYFEEINTLKKQQTTPVSVREQNLQQEVNALKTQLQNQLPNPSPALNPKEQDLQNQVDQLKIELGKKDQLLNQPKQETSIQTNEQELQRQIDALKMELAQKIELLNQPSQNDSLLKLQIEEQKNEIERLKKQLEESAQSSQNNESTTDLQRQIEELNQESSTTVPDSLIVPSKASEPLSQKPKKQKNTQMPGRKPKNNQSKETNLELFNITKKINEFEMQKTELSNCNFDKTNLKAEKMLEELINTERNFLTEIEKVVGFFNYLITADSTNSETYKNMSIVWSELIEQSKTLLSRLEPALQKDFKEKIEIYQNAFLPKNIKSYYEAHKKISQQNIHLRLQALKVLRDAYDRQHGTNIESLSIKPTQRVGSLSLFISQMKTHLPDELQAVLNLNHDYFKSYMELINALTPK